MKRKSTFAIIGAKVRVTHDPYAGDVDEGEASQRRLAYGVEVAVAASEYSKLKDKVAVALSPELTEVFTSGLKGLYAKKR